MDLICLSGYQLRSYLTFVKEYIPFDSFKMRDMAGIRNVFTVRDNMLGLNAVDVFIFVTTDVSTLVLVPIKASQFEEADPAKT